MSEPGMTPRTETCERTFIGKGIVVNVNEHDMARDTRLAKALDRVLRPIIWFLLKLSPRTVVLANVSLNGPFNTAITVYGNSALIVGADISFAPNDDMEGREI